MVSQRFIGTWKLVSSEYHRSDGTILYPFGQEVLGQIYYDASGHMAAQLMRANRPAFASGDFLNGTPDEIKSAFEQSLAYFGTYDVDEQTNAVIHHVVACTFPNWIGQDQKRYFEFSPNQLTLSTPPPLGRWFDTDWPANLGAHRLNLHDWK